MQLNLLPKFRLQVVREPRVFSARSYCAGWDVVTEKTIVKIHARLDGFRQLGFRACQDASPSHVAD
jgi:hypothetical protein